MNQMLRLTRCNYQVDIDNQVAVVRLSETFKHTGNGLFSAKYHCPMPEGASPTGLRWFKDNTWYTALISPTPQDSNAVGPGEIPQTVKDYLGFFPVMFNLDMMMTTGDSVVVELSYVQLLSYAYGEVGLALRNNYMPIQSYPVGQQSLSINLHSDRTIESLSLLSHPNSTLTNDGHDATLQLNLINGLAATDYQAKYALSTTELGLWAMSTYLDEVPDDHGQGFFTMLVEPDPSENTDVIAKHFSLIIDVSGSMGWDDKIQQARNAASYIVNNLNVGDYFNIISFSNTATTLWATHQPYSVATQNTALSFISNLVPLANTNISAAFTACIPQFTNAPDDAAKIIIFLTDGVPTAGITGTQALINHVNGLISQYEVDVNLFNFGIGTDVNQQLLTLLADDNNGVAQFLENEDLESSITDFYNLIRNPVILNPVFTATPASALTEVYPLSLPNLYLGRQMMICGRYASPQTVNINFSGNAFNQPISYNYEVALSDSANQGYQFLTRLWAKQKVEHLMVLYYSFPEGSAQAILIKAEIVQLSLDYGIITIFTSFSGGVDIEDDVETVPGAAAIVLKGNYPNPFNPVTLISFEVKEALHGVAVIKIFNLKGQLVRILAVKLNGKGSYEIQWDGRDEKGSTLSSGTYIYSLSTGNYVVCGKMTMMK